jgi:hypothetical protein
MSRSPPIRRKILPRRRALRLLKSRTTANVIHPKARHQSSRKLVVAVQRDQSGGDAMQRVVGWARRRENALRITVYLVAVIILGVLPLLLLLWPIELPAA